MYHIFTFSHCFIYVYGCAVLLAFYKRLLYSVVVVDLVVEFMVASYRERKKFSRHKHNKPVYPTHQRLHTVGGWLPDYRPQSIAFLPYTKWWGNFPTSHFTCPTSPLVTANANIVVVIIIIINAPPVFCPIQLRSVTDEQHVGMMWCRHDAGLMQPVQKQLAGEIFFAGRH